MSEDSSKDSLTQQLARIVIRGLAAGHPVEIDELGVFHPDPERGCRFEASTVPRVFLAYVKEDAETVGRLYDALEGAGFQPWMDTRKLVPGQKWPRAIECAIETSDFVIVCFSEASVNKRGAFQVEIRYALECARSMPLDQIFLVPIRLNTCRIPQSIQREFHYVDLFPDWRGGIRRLATTLRRELNRRTDLVSPPTL